MAALCISRKLRARSKQGFDPRSRYANNRPISFTSEDGQSIITCGYDYMGRRYMREVAVAGSIESHHHYLYRGYLQIATLDLTLAGAPALWYTHWDPTEPVATRPLSIRKNGTWYTFGHDLTKNVTELYKTDGSLEAAYDYTPFGSVTRQGTERQPFQWSSEVYDAELGMVYYNYRHYNPMDGRWINRDPIFEKGGLNLYQFGSNYPCMKADYLGMFKIDVIFDEPNAANVQVHRYTSTIYSPRRGSYTTRDHSFSCDCVCNPRIAITCTATYTPEIYLDRWQALNLNVSLAGILGHEQRHIISRTQRIKNTLNPLEQIDLDIYRQEECYNKANEIQEQYSRMIDNDFSEGDHAGDTHATPSSPANGQPEQPL